MKVLLIEGEGLNQQGGSVWIGRGGGSSAIILGNIPGGSKVSETINIDIVFWVLNSSSLVNRLFIQ